MQTRYTYFAPRLGAAYRLSEKTVVRWGFGISYTPFEDNTYAYNYPVRANNGYTCSQLVHSRRRSHQHSRMLHHANLFHL